MTAEASLHVAGSGGPGARDVRLDALKGLAIVLVVLGHALVRLSPASPVQQAGLVSIAGVGWVDPATLLNPLLNAVYTFHMPLFAFLSGRVAVSKSSGYGLAWLRRRFMSLMVPYFAWVVVAWALIGNRTIAGFVGFTIDAALNPLAPGGLWFLYALFACCVVFSVAKTMFKSDRALVGVALSIGALGIVPIGRFEHMFGLSELSWLFPFFVAGYMVAEYPSIIGSRSVVLPVALVLWLVSFAMIWPVLITGDRWWYGSLLSILGSQTGGYAAKALWAMSRVICAGAGIVVLYHAYESIGGSFALVQAWLGRRSLGIYAGHGWFLLPLGLGAGGVRVVTLFAIALAGGVALTFALEQLPATRLLLLGQTRKPAMAETERTIRSAA